VFVRALDDKAAIVSMMRSAVFPKADAMLVVTALEMVRILWLMEKAVNPSEAVNNRQRAHWRAYF